MWGESTNGYGVFGSSDNAVGVKGVSANGIGVFGQNTTGRGPAAKFVGNVEIVGNLNMQSGGDVILADCAEEFELLGTSTEAEPGSVMVLNEMGVIHPCDKPYDKRVVGVVSGAGSFRPAFVLDRVESAINRAPISLMGKVYCKVDASYGEIEVGDLLTTSPMSGHAMKAIDPLKAFGAVIGKALRPLKEGQGLIPILIALQ
jgi:hypothetical protein